MTSTATIFLPNFFRKLSSCYYYCLQFFRKMPKFIRFPCLMKRLLLLYTEIEKYTCIYLILIISLSYYWIQVRRRRLRGDLPPVYPNGWFQMCAAHDLRPGGLQNIIILQLLLLPLFCILGFNISMFTENIPQDRKC